MKSQSFNSFDSISIISFPSAFKRHLIRTEYTNEPSNGCHIFPWSAPPPLHSTSELHYTPGCMSIRKKEPSLPSLKLWIICSIHTPRMTSSPKQTSAWCIFRRHCGCLLRKTLKVFGMRRFDATEYETNIYSREPLLRVYWNPSDRAFTHTGLKGECLTHGLARCATLLTRLQHVSRNFETGCQLDMMNNRREHEGRRGGNVIIIKSTVSFSNRVFKNRPAKISRHHGRRPTRYPYYINHRSICCRLFCRRPQRWRLTMRLSAASV